MKPSMQQEAVKNIMELMRVNLELKERIESERLRYDQLRAQAEKLAAALKAVAPELNGDSKAQVIAVKTLAAYEAFKKEIGE